MPAVDDREYSFLNPEIVTSSLERLLSSKIHSHFAGYLALCRVSRRLKRLEGLPFEYREFFRTFMQANGLPETTPYLLPFRKGVRPGAPFMNSNLAGSYAPSSLRSSAPISKVATLFGEGSSMTLHADHAASALHHLCMDERVDALALSAFLYRDFGFVSGTKTLEELLDVFRDDFGFREGALEENTAFHTLFVVRSDWSSYPAFFTEGEA